MPTHIDFPLTQLLVYHGSVRTFHDLSTSELRFIIDDKICHDVTRLMFVANGNSDFMSAILENFCFEDCQF